MNAWGMATERNLDPRRRGPRPCLEPKRITPDSTCNACPAVDSPGCDTLSSSGPITASDAANTDAL